MPPPERQPGRPQHPPRPDRRDESSGPPPPGQSPGGRQRPAPTSPLAPSPAPLMSVPDPAASGQPSGSATDGGRAGKRQHHRRAGTDPAPAEQVYLSGRVPRRLRDELHIRAIGEGRPVVDLLRDAIRGYLDRPPTAGPR